MKHTYSRELFHENRICCFSDKNEELKYKFVLIELFSADCFHIFVTFIQVRCYIKSHSFSEELISKCWGDCLETTF